MDSDNETLRRIRGSWWCDVHAGFAHGPCTPFDPRPDAQTRCEHRPGSAYECDLRPIYYAAFPSTSEPADG